MGLACISWDPVHETKNKIPCKFQYSENDKIVSILSINTIDTTEYTGHIFPDNLNEWSNLWLHALLLLSSFYYYDLVNSYHG